MSFFHFVLLWFAVVLLLFALLRFVFEVYDELIEFYGAFPTRDFCRNFSLHSEHVPQVTLVGIRPKMLFGESLDEICGYPQAIASGMGSVFQTSVRALDPNH